MPSTSSQRAANPRGSPAIKRARTELKGLPARDLHIGPKLKAARQRIPLSLRALAERTGFSASFLSQVELEQVSPSLSSLARIAEALDIRLTELLAEAPDPQVVVIRRHGRDGLRSQWSRATVQSLLPSSAEERVEVVLLTLEAGGRSGKTPLVREGRELAFCVRGTVTLELEGVVHELAEGDSAFYEASRARHWENRTKNRVELLLIAVRGTRP
jgi:XRE family transcriptional regulator, regulator of sulfur utilization